MGSNHPDDGEPFDGETAPRRAHPGDVWGTVLDDMEATAEEFREAGWETLELHPGDVTIVEDTREPGIDALIPGSEFEDLQAYIDGGVSFDDYEVFRAESEGMVYAVIVAQDESTETAVLLPTYLDAERLSQVVGAGSDERVPVYLRRLDGEMYVLHLQDSALLLAED